MQLMENETENKIQNDMDTGIIRRLWSLGFIGSSVQEDPALNAKPGTMTPAHAPNPRL